MQVKGTAVKSIPEFIQSEHKEKYLEWLQLLSNESQAIFNNPIKANYWYPIEAAIIEPTLAMAPLIFRNASKAAHECGRFSAKLALTGVYSLYVKMSSPTHIIERAGRILVAYYNPSELIVAQTTKNSVTLHITQFKKPHQIIDARFAGWMEKALELSGCSKIKVSISKSLALGHPYSEFEISWK